MNSKEIMIDAGFGYKSDFSMPDFERIKVSVSNSALIAIICTTSIIICIILAYSHTSYFSLFLLLLIPLILGSHFLHQYFSKKFFSEEKAMFREAETTVKNSLENIEVVKAYCQEISEQNKFKELVENYSEADNKYTIPYVLLYGLLDCMIFISFSIFMLFLKQFLLGEIGNPANKEGFESQDIYIAFWSSLLAAIFAIVLKSQIQGMRRGLKVTQKVMDSIGEDEKKDKEKVNKYFYYYLNAI